jgi:diaminopimelate epimerase
MTPVNAVFNKPVAFEKWHGAENDFLFAETEDFFSALIAPPDEKLMTAAALALCHRNCGIGADGLVVWQKDADGRILAGIWNSDGSRAATCGNALRCLAGLLLDKSLWDGRKPLKVFELNPAAETSTQRLTQFATLLACQSENSRSGLFSARVDMGQLNDLRVIDRNQLMQCCLNHSLQLPDHLKSNLVSVTFVSLANPHLVLGLGHGSFTSLGRNDFVTAGQLLQSANVCSALGIPVCNIGFVELPEGQDKNRKRTLNGIVFERGAGLTPCCGSGGCAMKVALENEKYSQPDEAESIAMPGGVIQMRSLGKTLELTGPAQRVSRLTIG